MVEDVVIDDARAEVIRKAAYQAEAMIYALHRSADKDAEELPFLVAGMTPRLMQLVSVIMSAVDDSLDPTEELKARLQQPIPIRPNCPS